MKHPFKTDEFSVNEYISIIKELCIVEHEDTWFKDKSHANLYPNLEDAKKCFKTTLLDSKCNRCLRGVKKQ